jgi:energy-coupling factor transport system ATP-binding protein
VVFQQPEDQMFAATVHEEVAYGPRNLGVRGEDLSARIQWALSMVGLSAEEIGHRSPFHLSGGEKRLVAIASVLAMKPQFLLLDEPTVNLDSLHRKAVLGCLGRLNAEHGTGILVASHHLEEILPLLGRVLLVHRGQIVFDGKPDKAIDNADRIEDFGMEIPPLIHLMLLLRQRGLDVAGGVLSVQEAVHEIQDALERKGRVSAC